MRQRRAREVLDLVGMSGFERRDVALLSGGERQRVALARSLAPNPRLLMLDEPLGSLDAALKERLVVDLRAIIKQVGLTALYVTHDQHEAFVVADRIALMNAGQFEQVGTPSEVYRHPQTIFAARFLGMNNVVPVESIQRSPRADAARRVRLRRRMTPRPPRCCSIPTASRRTDGHDQRDRHRDDLSGRRLPGRAANAADIPLTFKLAARDQTPPLPRRNHAASASRRSTYCR